MFKRRTITRLMAALSFAPAAAVAQGQAPLSRIALGSCAKQTMPQPIWDAVLAWRPELFVFMGDNVYGDFNSADATGLREAYAATRQIAGYQKLRALLAQLVATPTPEEARARQEAGILGSIKNSLSGCVVS